MPPPKNEKAAALSRDLLQGLDSLFGVHPGYRPVHAKGVMLVGEFQPFPAAASLSRAPHFQAPTPVTVRVSDFAGIPAIPDNDPEGASPRGFAIRFHLGEHLHTDIVSHSYDGFPTRTANEFVEFLRAAASSDPSKPHPNPIEVFLTANPKALAFVQGPKPFPTSFARESYFSVSAFKFTGPAGASRYGRYQIHPDAGNEYLDSEAAAARSANYLFDELKERVSKGPVKFHFALQLAEDGDVVDDATVRWPEERSKLPLGEIVLNAEVSNDDAEKHRIIFDPIPRVNGIDASADPLLEARADVYLLSGRRRRSATQP
jgi:catalase